MNPIKRLKHLKVSVIKSIAEQIKLLAWAIGGINSYFRHVLGEKYGIILVIIAWLSFQFIAHYILNHIKEEQQK